MADRPSPGPSSSSSATLPLSQNSTTTTQSYSRSPSLSPVPDSKGKGRAVAAHRDASDDESEYAPRRSFPRRGNARTRTGLRPRPSTGDPLAPIKIRVILRPPPSPLDEPPPSSKHEQAAPSHAHASAAKRKRVRMDANADPEAEDSDEEYNPAAMRGGGRPPKSRPKRNPGPNAASQHAAAAIAGSRRTTRSKAKRACSPSDLITTSLEDIKVEDAAVKAEISRLGLALRDVQGDGNCLFRCLSDQVFGGEKRHSEIRKLVCDYLESHRETMEGFVVPFMKDGEGYDGYVKRMRQPKQFGSHIEIQAAARIFKRDVRVVMSTASFTIPWRAESPSTSPSPPAEPMTPGHSTRSRTYTLLSSPVAPPPDSPLYANALADYIPPVREGRSMLWLALFSQAEHFQSVRRKGDRESSSAEVEDRLAIPHEKDTSEAARRERGELIDDPDKSKPSASLVSQLLASLPPRHAITTSQAEGVLARVKGNLGEAVEILLEEIEFDADTEQVSESSSDQRVEEMLRDDTHVPHPPHPPQTLLGNSDAYREPGGEATSPAATSSTVSRSRSTSRTASASGSVTDSRSRSSSVLGDSVSSGCTTVSESGEAATEAPASRPVTRSKKAQLGKELEGMGLGSREASREEDEVGGGRVKRGGLRTAGMKEGRTRRKVGALGIVGV
ncbi:hypothetical protein IAT38_007264 [Cryptococcus sp. DSM 104549]